MAERLVVSYRGLNLNTDGFSTVFVQSLARPSKTAVVVERDGAPPLITQMRHTSWQLPPLNIMLESVDDIEAARLQIFQAFDTAAPPDKLIIADVDGENERYVIAACVAIDQVPGEKGLTFVATLIVSGDQHWQSETETTSTETITTSGDTFVIDNGGELDAYPIIEIAPQQAKSGDEHWKYRDFCVIRWRSPAGEKRYPINVVGAGYDTTGLTPTKAIDGTSLGVIVDGVEAERFLGADDGNAGGFDSTSTKVWCNLDFQPALSVTLASGFGTSAITEILVNEDISTWPACGILFSPVTSELFTYSGKDNYRRAFTGISREAYNTSASSQGAGQALEWIQHEIFVVYTPEEDMALVPDEANRPLLDLVNSTNDIWIWDNAADPNSGFGDTFPKSNRPAKWTPFREGDATVFFTDQDFFSFTNPHEAAGIRNLRIDNHPAGWQVYLPCGIGDYEIDGDDYFETDFYNGGGSAIQLSADGQFWLTQDFTNGSVSSWTSWQETANGLDNSWRYLRFYNGGSRYASQMTRVEITNHADLRPFISRTGEVANYQLSMTITNETTEEAIMLNLLPGLEVGTETVEVDTVAKTVTLTPTGRNIYNAFRRDTLRPQMLRLEPGSNTLRIDDTDLTDVDVTVTFRQRWHS